MYNHNIYTHDLPQFVECLQGGLINKAYPLTKRIFNLVP